MKPGTLVKCPLWGKGIVVEELFQINGAGTRPVVLVLWNKPKTTDRKSTRLNSSHGYISYAVFCLKKKKRQKQKRNQNTLNN